MHRVVALRAAAGAEGVRVLGELLDDELLCPYGLLGAVGCESLGPGVRKADRPFAVIAPRAPWRRLAARAP